MKENRADMAKAVTTPILLAESQVEKGAQLFARIFHNAPDMKYLIGENIRINNEKILNYYMSIIRIGLFDGEVYTTSSLDGIAVWVNPENAQLNLGIFLRTGFLKALLRMGLKSFGRFVSSAYYLDRLQKQVITDPCWMLIHLGVEPALQGNGIGGALIQPILARADAEGVSCYVESADERNLSFYKRHGFVIVKQGQIPNDGPKVWFMVRESGIAS